MSIPLKEKIQKAHVRLHEIIKDTNDLEFLLQQKLKEHGKVSAKLASLQEELFGMDSSSHIEVLLQCFEFVSHLSDGDDSTLHD